MNKLEAVSIKQSQMKLIQEMQRVMQLSGREMAPIPAVNFGEMGQPLSFSSVFNRAIDNVNQIQNSAADKQRDYELGLHDDLSATMLESQKASVAFSAMIQTRNKLVSSLDEILNTSL